MDDDADKHENTAAARFKTPKVAQLEGEIKKNEENHKDIEDEIKKQQDFIQKMTQSLEKL